MAEWPSETPVLCQQGKPGVTFTSAKGEVFSVLEFLHLCEFGLGLHSRARALRSPGGAPSPPCQERAAGQGALSTRLGSTFSCLPLQLAFPGLA